MDQLEAPEAGTEFLRLLPPRTSPLIAEAGAFEPGSSMPWVGEAGGLWGTHTGLGFWGVLQVSKEVNLGN